MRKTALVSVVLILLGLSLLVAGCDSPDSTTTTVLSGGSGTGDTSGAGTATSAGSTATSAGSTATTLATGGTPVTGETGNSILGKWYNAVTGETLEFFADGTVTGSRFADMKGVTVTYAISGDQLTVSALGTTLVTQTFSIDGGTLTIVDSATGISGTLQRVE